MNLKRLLNKNRFLIKKARAFHRWEQMFNGINWYKTLYLNFKTQKCNIAFRLPILIYGKLKINDLSGKILLNGPIYTGMIRLGLNTDKFSASNGSALLIVKGTLIFKGAALISVDYTFDIIGTCILGDMVGLGNSVRIRCWEKVEIGKGSRITVNSQIFDTNFHYTRNVETGEIARARKAIYIGRFCWIGNRTTIMMGTYLPDYSIVAGNSLVNKKYIKDIPNYPMFAGIPAKLIRAGYVRVFDIKLETEVNDYFKNTPTSNIYHAQSGFIDESEEIANAFRWFYR